MPELYIDLHLSPDALLRYYRGEARNVRARATTGQVVQFPAGALQRHVAVDGIHGRFRLVFDENYRFVQLEAVRSLASESGFAR
jgi:hypothetical protein